MDATLVLIALTTGASVVLLTLYIYGSVFVPQRALRARMAAAQAGDTTALAAPLLRRQRPAIPFLDLLPLSKEANDRLNRELAQAGVLLRVREYVLIRFACLFGLFALGYLLVALADAAAGLRLAGAVVLGLVGWYLPRVYISRRRAKRLEAVEKQLPEALTAMAKALRAGSGLLQALARAADETDAPLGPELRTVIRDLQLGAEAEDVFGALVERVGSQDLDIAVTAIVIQRNVGGNLGEVLGNVAHTVRERAKLRGEIRVLTSSQKLTGNLTAAVPVIVALLFIAINPDLGRILVTTTVGLIALGVGIFFELLGLWLIRRLAVIDI